MLQGHGDMERPRSKVLGLQLSDGLVVQYIRDIQNPAMKSDRVQRGRRLLHFHVDRRIPMTKFTQEIH